MRDGEQCFYCKGKFEETHPSEYDHLNDHPEDNRGTFTGSDGRAYLGEGKVVRYYIRPDIDGDTRCRSCGDIMHAHGWIDAPEGGLTVCPGDWIIKTGEGVFHPLKPDMFDAKYEPQAHQDTPDTDVGC